MQLLVDLLIAAVMAAALILGFRRLLGVHGPWQHRWAFALVVFLAAWAGGAWLAPTTSGWVVYWVPFLLVGLAVALLIAATSPSHPLDTPEDVEEFEHEQRAVATGLTLFFWVLIAGLLVSLAARYF